MRTLYSMAMDLSAFIPYDDTYMYFLQSALITLGGRLGFHNDIVCFEKDTHMLA